MLPSRNSNRPMANRRTRLPAPCVGYPCVGFPASISFEKHPFEHLLQLVLTAVRAVRHVLIDSVVGKTSQRTRNVLAIECGNEFFDPMPGLHDMTPFGVAIDFSLPTRSAIDPNSVGRTMQFRPGVAKTSL